MSAYKRENASLKAMLKDHIAFLRKVEKTSSEKNEDDTANNSINLADLIIPEIESVRK